MTSMQLVEAARRLVGTPFRLHGRDPRTGVDCLGLVIAALDMIGARTVTPRGYGLRQTSITNLLPFARDNGFQPVVGRAELGDLILFALPAAQHHVAITLVGKRIIHAHAGLRRVVEGMPGSDWRIERIWRHSLQSKE
ncbi:MAG TPA: NlpC/P60 family protein [Croceicoccus sp.]|nr:NlpC/P60 family protein [Croceicoccus sp.]